MKYNAECKKCNRSWKPTLHDLSIIPHEAGRAVDEVREVRTSYCPTCDHYKVQVGLAKLERTIQAGGCPGPLLWGRV